MDRVIYKWVVSNKFSTYILFFVNFLITLTSFTIAIIVDIGDEVEKIKEVILTEGAPAIAIFSIIFIFLMIFVYLQLLLTSFILYLVAKYIFKITSTFSIFLKTIFISNIFLVIGGIFHILFFSGYSSNILLLAINPFLILSVLLIYYLVFSLMNTTKFRALLFSVTIYLISLTSLFLGGLL